MQTPSPNAQYTEHYTELVLNSRDPDPSHTATVLSFNHQLKMAPRKLTAEQQTIVETMVNRMHHYVCLASEQSDALGKDRPAMVEAHRRLVEVGKPEGWTPADPVEYREFIRQMEVICQMNPVTVDE